MRRSRQHSRKNRGPLKRLASVCLLFALIGLAYAITLPAPSNKGQIVNAKLPGTMVSTDKGHAENIKEAKGKIKEKGNHTPEERDSAIDIGDFDLGGGELLASNVNYDAITFLPYNRGPLNYNHPTHQEGAKPSSQGDTTPGSHLPPGFRSAGNSSRPTDSPKKRGKPRRSRRSGDSTPGGGLPGGGAAPSNQGGSAPTNQRSAIPSNDPALNEPTEDNEATTSNPDNDNNEAPLDQENGTPDDNTDSDDKSAENSVIPDNDPALNKPTTGDSEAPTSNPGSDDDGTPLNQENGAPGGNTDPDDEIAENSNAPGDNGSESAPPPGKPGDTPWDIALEEPVRIDGTEPIDGPVVIGPGTTISPGDSPGTLEIINGDFILQEGGLLEIEFAGTGSGLFDILDISGDAIFEAGGTIEFSFIDGYTPLLDDSFEFLLANSITGFDWDNPDWLTLLIVGLPTDFGFTIDRTQANDGRDSLTFRVTAAAGQTTSRGQTVPEPATLLLICLGLIGMAYRQKSASA
ncbi:MAG: PEP-CTERM sorting domain-containing protein [Candidatus Polarisedimenticolaceae bacterium]|nr:PEP-CTERM sorting domain-containing protein [Candidatus Polarisedimenticolaceae bacterium]